MRQGRDQARELIRRKKEIAEMRRRQWRAVVEVAFIMFLFYSNLLMGEYEQANSATGRSFLAALADIFTPANFVIGLAASLVGYAAVEFLRTKLWDGERSNPNTTASRQRAPPEA